MTRWLMTRWLMTRRLITRRLITRWLILRRLMKWRLRTPAMVIRARIRQDKRVGSERLTVMSR